MTHTIFIDGEAGTTGLEIRERLEARPDLELVLLGDRRRDVDARREGVAASFARPSDLRSRVAEHVRNTGRGALPPLDGEVAPKARVG